MSVLISVRLPDKDASALEKLATATDRSKSYLVKQAVESYLAEYEDYRVALDRLRDTGDNIISGPELRKRLATAKRRRARHRG